MKSESILIRVSPGDKVLIRNAAELSGQSVTSFVLQSTVKAARNAKSKEPSRYAHGGVPSFFKGCCNEARQGGTFGYDHPGWHLANALQHETPEELSQAEWTEELESLVEFLTDNDIDGAWDWFNEHFPKCMTLIPARRKDQFIAGVVRAYEDGRI